MDYMGLRVQEFGTVSCSVAVKDLSRHVSSKMHFPFAIPS